MSWRDDTTIRHGIKIGFAEIECRVHTDGEPQRSRTAKRETKKHSRHEHAQRANGSLSRIAQVHRTKRKGKQQRGRPKSHSRRQSELQISAKKELLVDSYNHKNGCPFEGVTHYAGAGKIHCAEGVSAQQVND